MYDFYLTVAACGQKVPGNGRWLCFWSTHLPREAVMVEPPTFPRDKIAMFLRPLPIRKRQSSTMHAAGKLFRPGHMHVGSKKPIHLRALIFKTSGKYRHQNSPLSCAAVTILQKRCNFSRTETVATQRRSGRHWISIGQFVIYTFSCELLNRRLRPLCSRCWGFLKSVFYSHVHRLTANKTSTGEVKIALMRIMESRLTAF